MLNPVFEGKNLLPTRPFPCRRRRTPFILKTSSLHWVWKAGIQGAFGPQLLVLRTVIQELCWYNQKTSKCHEVAGLMPDSKLPNNAWLMVRNFICEIILTLIILFLKDVIFDRKKCVEIIYCAKCNCCKNSIFDNNIW